MTNYINKYNYVLTNVNKTKVLLVMDRGKAFPSGPVRLKFPGRRHMTVNPPATPAEHDRRKIATNYH
jgi:hypothetical protein